MEGVSDMKMISVQEHPPPGYVYYSEKMKEISQKNDQFKSSPNKKLKKNDTNLERGSVCLCVWERLEMKKWGRLCIFM